MRPLPLPWGAPLAQPLLFAIGEDTCPQNNALIRSSLYILSFLAVLLFLIYCAPTLPLHPRGQAMVIIFPDLINKSCLHPKSRDTQCPPSLLLSLYKPIHTIKRITRYPMAIFFPCESIHQQKFLEMKMQIQANNRMSQ